MQVQQQVLDGISGDGERQPDPSEWMHGVWREELGRDRGPALQLTERRRQKYRAMWEEQLAGLDRPRVAWRMVLRCVQDSDHHMSKRSYQMPESLLRNKERRSRWVQETVQWSETGGGVTAAELRRRRKKRRIREELEKADDRGGRL